MAKVLAAKRGTSVSALVARELSALVEHDERYDAARHRATQLMEQETARSVRRWSREDLYAERLDRRGR